MNSNTKITVTHDNELVSVIIPSYNHDVFIKKAIDSVLAQTYTNFEIIVVDNFSTDKTDEILKKINDHRLSIYKVRNNGVVAASRNFGISKSKGSIIAFLDSDDFWYKNKLKLSVEILNNGFDFVYHDCRLITDKLRFFFKRNVGTKALKNPIHHNLIRFGNPIINSSVVLKKTIIQMVGGFSENPQLVAVEDYECWLRISKKTDNFAFIDEILGAYWHGSNNLSNYKNSIVNLPALKMLYSNDFLHLENEFSIYWLDYQLARAYYLNSEYLKAKEMFYLLLRSRISYTIWLKSFIMLFHIYMIYLFKNLSRC